MSSFCKNFYDFWQRKFYNQYDVRVCYVLFFLSIRDIYSRGTDILHKSRITRISIISFYHSNSNKLFGFILK